MQRTVRIVRLAMLEAKKVTVQKIHLYAGDPGARELNEKAKHALADALDRWIGELTEHARKIDAEKPWEKPKH
jgi:hypothetical protein